MKNRENQRIIERKKFMEEALIINEPKYKAQYERKQKELAEEIGYKEEEVQSAEEGSINIFMNLEEGVLNQLVEENRKNEEVCGCVRNWKDVYENLKKLWFVWNIVRLPFNMTSFIYLYGEKIRAPCWKDQTGPSICWFFLWLSQFEFSSHPRIKCNWFSQLRKLDSELDSSQSQKSSLTSTHMWRRLNFQLSFCLNWEILIFWIIFSSLHMEKVFPQLDMVR